MTRHETALALPRRSFTIPELCGRHRISRAKYYELRGQGLGPDEFRPGGSGTVRITEEAERAWVKRLTKKARAK